MPNLFSFLNYQLINPLTIISASNTVKVYSSPSPAPQGLKVWKIARIEQLVYLETDYWNYGPSKSQKDTKNGSSRSFGISPARSPVSKCASTITPFKEPDAPLGYIIGPLVSSNFHKQRDRFKRKLESLVYKHDEDGHGVQGRMEEVYTGMASESVKLRLAIIFILPFLCHGPDSNHGWHIWHGTDRVFSDRVASYSGGS